VEINVILPERDIPFLPISNFPPGDLSIGRLALIKLIIALTG